VDWYKSPSSCFYITHLSVSLTSSLFLASLCSLSLFWCLFPLFPCFLFAWFVVFALLCLHLGLRKKFRCRFDDISKKTKTKNMIIYYLPTCLKVLQRGFFKDRSLLPICNCERFVLHCVRFDALMVLFRISKTVSDVSLFCTHRKNLPAGLLSLSLIRLGKAIYSFALVVFSIPRYSCELLHRYEYT
jgi:hypothetical protein